MIPLGLVDPNKGISVPFSSTPLSLLVMLCSGVGFSDTWVYFQWAVAE